MKKGGGREAVPFLFEAVERTGAGTRPTVRAFGERQCIMSVAQKLL